MDRAGARLAAAVARGGERAGQPGDPASPRDGSETPGDRRAARGRTPGGEGGVRPGDAAAVQSAPGGGKRRRTSARRDDTTVDLLGADLISGERAGWGATGGDCRRRAGSG